MKAEDVKDPLQERDGFQKGTYMHILYCFAHTKNLMVAFFVTYFLVS